MFHKDLSVECGHKKCVLGRHIKAVQNSCVTICQVQETSAKEDKAFLTIWKELCVLLVYTLVRIQPQHLFKTSAVWLARLAV